MTLMRRCNALLVGLCSLIAAAVSAQAADFRGFPPSQAIYNQPFNAKSVWKAKPTGSIVLQGSISTLPTPGGNFPFTSANAPVYWAHPEDPPANVTVTFITDDFSSNRVLVMPHWPPGVVPGTTSDHLAIIFDPTTNLFHDFFELSGSGSTWTALNYNVSSAIPSNPYWYGGASQDFGIGTPARPTGGVSGAGKPTIGGELRNWELSAIMAGGTNVIQHALYLLPPPNVQTANTATTGPPPQFPATVQDGGFIYTGASQGTASWPLGQFFMLPSTFNLSSCATPTCKEIARALMTFGGYSMDTTGAAGFEFAAENPILSNGLPQSFNPYTTPSSYTNNWGGIWTSSGGFQDTDMKPVLSALQSVVSVGGWVDGGGNVIAAPTQFADMNLLGMRGPWSQITGTISGSYLTERNAYIVTPGSAAFIAHAIINQPLSPQATGGPWQNWSANTGGGGINGWLVAPTLGRSYTLTIYGTGNMTFNLLIYDQSIVTQYYGSPTLGVGQSATFNWPNQASTATILQINNPASGGGAIRAELVGN